VGLLAHDHPERVRALIDALAHDDVIVVLHVDARSAFDIGAYLPDDAERVVVIEPRFRVQWGSVALVDALTATMRTARDLDPGWFSLISGSCWPTRSPGAIIERLDTSDAAGFLDAGPLSEGLWRRLDFYHVPGDLPRPVRSVVNRARVRIPRRDRDRIPPAYGGSAWMDLRGDVLGWVVDRLAADPSYRKAFAGTLIADEVYVHTLLMDSPFRDDLVVTNDADRHLLGLRYIRWEGGWHPQLLTPADLAQARQLDCLFARKLG